MIKNLKADFIQNNLKEFANDSERFWAHVKTVLSGKLSGNIPGKYN